MSKRKAGWKQGDASRETRVIQCPECGAKNRVPAAAKGRPRCAKCHADLPWIVDTTDRQFDSVVSGPVPAVVDLWAPWCGPCKVIGPALEKVAHDMKGDIKLVKVNVDQNPKVSARYGVQGIPTLLFLDDGALIDQVVGARGERELKKWINQNLKKVARTRP